ncbi:MAG: cytochrome P450 [Gammaproteobacteria bacterium]|nr:cytochrome P450 [Gammaproteobacteria bacterium]
MSPKRQRRVRSEPPAFDPKRDNACVTSSFRHGIHMCIGAPNATTTPAIRQAVRHATGTDDVPVCRFGVSHAKIRSVLPQRTGSSRAGSDFARPLCGLAVAFSATA